MSAQSHPEPAEGPSRRSMLRGAGAVGAVGIAAAVGVGAAGGAAAAATRPAADHRAAVGAEHSPGPAGAPLVVYLRDAVSGELDIFSGTSHTVLRDPALVARLTHAVR
jgi:nitrous oxide reductase